MTSAAVGRRRARAIALIQRRLAWPRLQMMLVVALTGATGFLSSFILLRSGVEALALRYLLSVVIAYAAFLVLLGSWLRLGRRKIGDLPDPTDFTSAGDFKGGGVDRAPWLGGGRSGGGGATGAFEGGPGLASVDARVVPAAVPGRSNLADVGGLVDVEEIAAVVAAIVAVTGAVLAAAWIVWAAPALLAELSLDAAVSTGLYRRLRGVGGDHWLRTAIRRTALPFLMVSLLFGVAGALIQHFVPEATSMGDVFRSFTER